MAKDVHESTTQVVRAMPSVAPFTKTVEAVGAIAIGIKGPAIKTSLSIIDASNFRR
jgi:hypothetical protein